MSRAIRIAQTTASAALCAAMTVGCGALHDAPISNAKANPNVATRKVEAPEKSRKAKTGTPDEAGKTASKETVVKAQGGKSKKKPNAESKETKTDPQGQKDMTPVAQTSDIPAWVTAINWAQTKLGHKYVWGGDGYDNPWDGFDCSGLMLAAYARAGIKLPRVAQDQYPFTNVHPRESELRPGDLVFFGTRRNLHHVGMYVGKDKQGNRMMLHAPNSRKLIQFSPIHYMNDYYGATRVSP